MSAPGPSIGLVAATPLIFVVAWSSGKIFT